MEKQINRKKVTEPSYSKGLKASEKYLINDIATGSKAMVPIQVDAGQEVEIVQLDGGLIQDLPEGKHCCDNLVFTLDSTVQNLKMLCRRMYSLSGQRKQVKDMFMLFCYIKPNKNCSKAAKRGNKAPYDIQCYSNSAGYIPYPSMLQELLK
ncbi:MAG: hypothetical protein IJY09_09710 [Lachnospiraceae bacterium]|nr:hypothetical protein [Lachnospiraceae bacterium]